MWLDETMVIFAQFDIIIIIAVVGVAEWRLKMDDGLSDILTFRYQSQVVEYVFHSQVSSTS